MRPCHRCREPIENRVAACPRCGAAQDDGPKVNSDPPPPRSRRAFARQLLGGILDLFTLGTLGPLVAWAVAVLSLVLVGAAGYLVAGQTGAAVGVTGAIALVLGVVIWAESGD